MNNFVLVTSSLQNFSSSDNRPMRSRVGVKAWKNSVTSGCVVRTCPSLSVSPSKPKMRYWLHYSPKSTPTVRRSRLGLSSARWRASPRFADVAFGFSFPLIFYTSSARTSFVLAAPGRATSLASLSVPASGENCYSSRVDLLDLL